MRNTLCGGHCVGLVTAAGMLSGLLSWAIAAALGLSALLQASRLGYDIVRFAGAAYLIWLGLNTLGLFGHRHRHDGGDVPIEAPTRGTRKRRAYLNGLVSNLVNPKIGAFFIAFLPGFIPAGAGLAAPVRPTGGVAGGRVLPLCRGLGDPVPRLSGGEDTVAVAAAKAAWSAARRRFGDGVGTVWRLANAVVGGHLLSPNMDPPWAAA
ncbi:MAG: LysE family transporter [Actinomycetota bacterium]|nr:LysE family transporter [Actinomycetota bacterium]